MQYFGTKGKSQNPLISLSTHTHGLVSHVCKKFTDIWHRLSVGVGWQVVSGKYMFWGGSDVSYSEVEYCRVVRSYEEHVFLNFVVL